MLHSPSLRNLGLLLVVLAIAGCPTPPSTAPVGAGASQVLQASVNVSLKLKPDLTVTQVYLADAAGYEVYGVTAVKPEGNGQVTLQNVPIGRVFTVVAEGTRGDRKVMFRTLVKAAPQGMSVEISEATTLVTSLLLETLSTGGGNFSIPAFASASAAMAGVLQGAEGPAWESGAEVAAFAKAKVAASKELQTAIADLRQDLSEPPKGASGGTTGVQVAASGDPASSVPGDGSSTPSAALGGPAAVPTTPTPAAKPTAKPTDKPADSTTSPPADVASPTPTPTTNLDGNYSINSESSLAAFVQYETISGDLIVGPGCPAELSLPNLKVVGGDFHVNNSVAITSLKSFPKLTKIGGELMISGNPDLTSIAGFANLGAVTNINIQNLPKLESLAGLEKLTKVTGVVAIIANDSLANLSGIRNITGTVNSLQVMRNRSLKSLAGLEKITQIKSILNVVDNASLESVNGLNALKTGPTILNISANPELSSVDTLFGITSPGGNLDLKNEGNTSLPACAWRDFEAHLTSKGFTFTSALPTPPDCP